MNTNFKIIKDGMLVTICSIIAFAIAFMFYYLIFMLFETIANQDGSYRFVSTVRIGYGVIWIAVCLIIYRTKIYDWLKATILTCSLSTFMIGIGVQLYKMPIIAGLVMFLVIVASVFLIYKKKKKWYHYYAIFISIIATLMYLLPKP